LGGKLGQLAVEFRIGTVLDDEVMPDIFMILSDGLDGLSSDIGEAYAEEPDNVSYHVQP
jgi:hypothetical protein